MNEAAVKLNIPVQEEGGLRIPYAFCKKGFNVSRLLVNSAIFSFSCVKGNPDARCKMSFSKFEEKLRLSRATVNTAIQTSKRQGLISQDKSNRARAEYLYIGEGVEGGFIRSEYFLYHLTFKINGKEVSLPKPAVLVLSLIKTHNEDPGNGEFVGSVRGIARTLGLSKATVQKAIKLLLHIELIYRTQSDRGLNSYKRSRYTVNEKLLRKARKAYIKEASAQTSSQPTRTAQEAAVDARAERDRYYAELRNAAIGRAEECEQKLRLDARYYELNAKIKQLEISAASAEAFAPMKLNGLQRELKTLRVMRKRRMADLKVSESDIKPKWKCQICEDTGYRIKDGRICDCYPGNRRRS